MDCIKRYKEKKTVLEEFPFQWKMSDFKWMVSFKIGISEMYKLFFKILSDLEIFRSWIEKSVKKVPTEWVYVLSINKLYVEQMGKPY